MKPSAFRIERMLAKIEAALVPPPRKWLQVIIDEGNDEAEAKKTFTALSDGGQVQMPLTKTFFSPSFGMVTYRFGAMWMIIVAE